MTTNEISIGTTSEAVPTIHQIHTQILDNPCIIPRISSSFEEIDFALTSEYFNVYDNDGSLITQCSGTRDFSCDHWIDCLRSHPLNVDEINDADIYTITIQGSDEFDSLCTGNPYSLHVKVRFECMLNETLPTPVGYSGVCYFSVVFCKNIP